VKGECNDKKKTKFFYFGMAEPPPILSKDSERRVQWQKENEVFLFWHGRAASYLI
jgi:hypothetical protein